MDIIRHYVVWFPRWWEDGFDYWTVSEEDVFDVFGKNLDDAGLIYYGTHFHDVHEFADFPDFVILAEYIDDEDDYKSQIKPVWWNR